MFKHACSWINLTTVSVLPVYTAKCSLGCVKRQNSQPGVASSYHQAEINRTSLHKQDNSREVSVEAALALSNASNKHLQTLLEHNAILNRQIP